MGVGVGVMSYDSVSATGIGQHSHCLCLQYKAYKRAFQLFDDLLAEGHQGVASLAPVV